MLCDLALRQRRGDAQPVPQADDLPLAGRQRSGQRVVHGVVAVVFLHGRQTVVLAADDVLQGQRVAVAVGLERVG